MNLYKVKANVSTLGETERYEGFAVAEGISGVIRALAGERRKSVDILSFELVAEDVLMEGK